MSITASARRTAPSRQPPSADVENDRPAIICGIADAVGEEAVIAYAAGLAERLEGRLLLVHVQPRSLLALEPQIAYAARSPDPSTTLRRAGRRIARRAEHAGAASNTKLLLAFGDFAERLLVAARDNDAALIVLSASARSSTGRRSFARRLIADATCPVVVLPLTGAITTLARAVNGGSEPRATAEASHDHPIEVSVDVDQVARLDRR